MSVDIAYRYCFCCIVFRKYSCLRRGECHVAGDVIGGKTSGYWPCSQLLGKPWWQEKDVICRQWPTLVDIGWHWPTFLGVTQWLQKSGNAPTCHILTDNQATCASITKPKRQSGQTIIASNLDQIDHATYNEPQCQINITWIPGHMDIEGNERADAEAKHAATTPAASLSFKHRPLKSCRVQDIKKLTKDQWNRTWLKNTKTSQHLRRITTKQGRENRPETIQQPPKQNCVRTSSSAADRTLRIERLPSPGREKRQPSMRLRARETWIL